LGYGASAVTEKQNTQYIIKSYISCFAPDETMLWFCFSETRMSQTVLVFRPSCQIQILCLRALEKQQTRSKIPSLRSQESFGGQ